MDIVNNLKNDLYDFPDILDWYESIKDNKDYIVVKTEEYYFIVKPKDNKICRVEKLKENIRLTDILKDINNYLGSYQRVYVPLSKPFVIDSFSRNGFEITNHIKDKYKKGTDVFLMVKY